MGNVTEWPLSTCTMVTKNCRHLLSGDCTVINYSSNFLMMVGSAISDIQVRPSHIMTTQLRPTIHPHIPTQRLSISGNSFTKILRRESADRVERYKLECLGWETALAVAREFNKGRARVAGEGSGTGFER
jgi:hypothetical protein